MLPSDMAGGKFMTTRLSTLLSAALLIAASICGEPISAGEFATKEEAIAMVKKAAALINEQGPDKAYTQFSSKSGPFHDRDLYITVLDLDGKVLAHGQREDLIGKVLVDLKDPDGKLFINERRTGASAILILAELQIHEPGHQAS
jgi:cytochrome c